MLSRTRCPNGFCSVGDGVESKQCLVLVLVRGTAAAAVDIVALLCMPDAGCRMPESLLRLSRSARRSSLCVFVRVRNELQVFWYIILYIYRRERERESPMCT